MRTERQLINSYLKDIRPFPKLTKEDEVRYLREYQRHNNPDALRKLIHSNLRFVVSVAVKYQHQGLSLPELINEGNLGLMEAIKRFNLDSYGALKFISYAVWWIRQAIMKAVYDKSRLIRAPINKGNKVGAINRVLDMSLQKFGFVDYPFIAKKLAVSVEEIATILSLNNNRISLDAPVEGDDNKEVRHFLADEKAESPDRIVDDESQRKAVGEMVQVLNGKEKDVIRDYFGLGQDVSLNLDQISKKLRISKERVRQIRNKALLKMRKRGQHTRSLPRTGGF